MKRFAAPCLSLALAALLTECAIPHQDAAMQGNANGVVINYVGDLGETVPLAQKHCAEYERVPVLRQTQENNAIYDCVPVNAPPRAQP